MLPSFFFGACNLELQQAVSLLRNSSDVEQITFPEVLAPPPRPLRVLVDSLERQGSPGPSTFIVPPDSELHVSGQEFSFRFGHGSLLERRLISVSVSVVRA